MKEILVVSGKGGTGKTSITAALASLFENVVFADCDVDASDLHLILSPDIKEAHDFISGHVANIRQEDCIQCGICMDACRYNAVKIDKEEKYYIDEFACEGCGVCVWECPNGAIDFPDSLCGQWYISDTRFGTMIHAELAIAAENSGKLVSMVREQAREIAKQNSNDIVLIDGPPGIGCPVIASMTGVDAVVVVTEPTLSGLHDMNRVIELAKHFEIDTYVCINKYDVNTDMTEKIKQLLSDKDIQLIGEIPYDNDITAAQIEKKCVIEYSDGKVSKEIIKMFQKLKEKIKI